MGFEEISHTADWSAHIWAEDLPSLFIESARAMNKLAGIVLAEDPRVKRTFEAEGNDAESLLISFLSELIYYQEQENLAFEFFELEVGSSAKRDGAQDAHNKLEAEMEGGQIVSADKAIKAATYHNLRIEKTSRGFETTIVFDV
jgi:SHS2 domain-containing protein